MENEIKQWMEELAEDLDKLPMVESSLKQTLEDVEWERQELMTDPESKEKFRNWKLAFDRERRLRTQLNELERRVAWTTNELKGLFGGVGNLTSWDGFTVLVLEGDEYLVNGDVVELGEAFLDAIV